jgi:hypothetical protein
MRNGTVGQLGKYFRAALTGSACGAVGGALYAAVWGLTHWAVSGKGLSPVAVGPWFLLIGAALGLVAALSWAASEQRQPQVSPPAAPRRPLSRVPNRLGDTALLRRLGG